MKFSDMGITVEAKSFTGEKISVDDILNCEIKVLAYKIAPSTIEKKKGNGLCLHLSFEHQGKQRIIFSGSAYLQAQIEKVDKEKFPFTATIKRDGKRLMFS
jgi:hypothetical protein